MAIAPLTDTKTTASSLATNSSTTSTSTQAAASASPAARAMDKAFARIQTQLDNNSTQLSAFGKLKSSVSEVQLASKALRGFTSTSSAADVRTALGRFVLGLNTAVATAKTTAALPGSSSAETSSAGRVSRDLGRSITANTTNLDAMKKLGLKPQADGSFAWDGSQLDAAYKADPAAVLATLAKLGQSVDATATKELATDATVSGSMASLSQRASALKAQQTSLLAVVQSLNASNSSSTNSANSGSTGYVNYGVSAYLSW